MNEVIISFSLHQEMGKKSSPAESYFGGGNEKVGFSHAASKGNSSPCSVAKNSSSCMQRERERKLDLMQLRLLLRRNEDFSIPGGHKDGIFFAAWERKVG